MAYCDNDKHVRKSGSIRPRRFLWPRVCVLGASLVLVSPLTLAEEIVYVPPPEVDFAMPQNNQSGKDVRRQFGEPVRVQDAVGDPPISRWYYADYTVYLERDRVIIAVPRN